MTMRRAVVSIAVAAALLAACDKQTEESAAVAPSATQPVATSDGDNDAVTATPAPAPAPAPAAGAETPGADPVVPSFDISAIKISDKPLPEWPYVVLPAGYHYDNANDIAGASKDLARVPLWTGSELVWLEGRTFSDDIRNDEGKSFSKFEVRKNLQQAIESLGGQRLSEKSYDETVYRAHEKELEDFRQEFNDIRDAYWYDKDADTYLIRRADQAIWIVTEVNNDSASLMVAEGPLPAPSAD